jgi:hypothetical protein
MLQEGRCQRGSRGGREVEVASVAVGSAAAETAGVGIVGHEDTKDRAGLVGGYRHSVEAEVAEAVFGYTAVQEVGTAYLDIDGEGYSPAVASELDAVGLYIADIADIAEVVDLEQAWNGSSCSVAEVSSSVS